MGYSGCPCYQKYYQIHGGYCDDISCADYPLLEEARKKSK